MFQMMFQTASLFPRLRAAILCVALSVFVLGGCASTGNPRDPLEPMNRAIYTFNDGVDALVLKPAAGMYRDLIPQFIRTGVSNFFSNINDVIVALNNTLQGKIPAAMNDMGRVLVNTTLGVFGIMDPATQLGVEKNNEDFGQTLGFWGVGDGPYIVLTFLGPSNLRDTVGWVGDAYTWPVSYLQPTRHRNTLIGLRLVEGRAGLLEASEILQTAALDPYEFVRDAYLQRRRNLVHDGNPPDDSGEDPRARPSSQGPVTPPSPLAAEARVTLGTVLAPTLELPPAGERPVQSVTPAPQPATTATPEDPKKSRVVRLWLPSSRN
jgi:phospholipid-binding lipoprotein MlaA